MIISIPNSFSAENVEVKSIEKTPDPKPFDCITELMSQPSCINRLNATNACKLFGNSPEAVTMIQKCVAKQGFIPGTKIMAPENIIALCLGGISGSSKAKDNETYCKVGDDKKSLGITDSQIPTKVDSDVGSKIESNSIPK